VPAVSGGLYAFVLGVFSWALLGFGNIYCGLARRALDLTVENLKKKTSIGLSRSLAYHAEAQHGVAEMVLDLEAIEPHLDRVARDYSDGLDLGAAWVIKIVAAKYIVSATCVERG
jgi:alkylation response protein AidB-like acyl-CoA dehydrogenase